MGAYEDSTGRGVTFEDEDPDVPQPAEPDPRPGVITTGPAGEPDPTMPWWLYSKYEDAKAFIDFVGKQYSSWPVFYAELSEFYQDSVGSVDILRSFLDDLQGLFGHELDFWLNELQPIFEHDPLFEEIINEMGLPLPKITATLPEMAGTPALADLDTTTDTDWYLGINERLKRHPAFESEVDKLLAGILS